MPRIRTIKPEFPQSESMGRVSRDARLTFIMMWTLADDDGRLRGNSRMLASLLFPYDTDAPKLIDRWMDELVSEKCITRYLADGGAYIQINKWLSHQKIDRPSPSKIPAPIEASIPLANDREGSSLDQGPGPKDQGPGSGPKEGARARNDDARSKRTDVADFKPDDEDCQYALDRGRDPAAVLESIGAWASNVEPQSKRLKRDPRAFYQNWVRNAASRGECGVGGQRQDRARPASLLAAAAKVIAQGEAEPGIRSPGVRPGEAA